VGRTKRRRIDREARELFDGGRFLFHAGRAIRDLGVIGERRNCLILTLAAMTRVFESPVSVLVRGSPSTGKSTLIKRSLELHPPELQIERSSLSAKALVNKKESLAHKIFYLQEYRGGKDARLLMRLLQSEGAIAHEFTTIRGSQRATVVAARSGSPVIVSSTTELKVFEDDETRFLSIWADESDAQNLAVLKAQLETPKRVRVPNLSRWRAVFNALVPSKGDLPLSPKWLTFVAKRVPRQLVRVRRDWDRFLILLKAIALTRRCPGTRTKVNVEFQDYCVAYRILEPALAATMQGVPGQELEIVKAVRALSRTNRDVTVKDVARHLGRNIHVTYKYARKAINHDFLKYAPGRRERNLKPLETTSKRPGFLPKPVIVLKNNPELGNSVRFVDPFKGKSRRIEYPSKAAQTPPSSGNEKTRLNSGFYNRYTAVND
jgi:hypothetical protein